MSEADKAYQQGYTRGYQLAQGGDEKRRNRERRDAYYCAALSSIDVGGTLRSGSSAADNIANDLAQLAELMMIESDVANEAEGDT